jgi:hypothetical protein
MVTFHGDIVLLLAQPVHQQHMSDMHPSLHSASLYPSTHFQDDPVTGVAVKPEDLFTVFQKLTDENLRVS